MMTLQQHLDEHLPHQRWPNADWARAIARQCSISYGEVCQAVHTWKPRPPSPPPLVDPIAPAPAPVAKPAPGPARPRGFDAVVDAFRRHGHELKANRNGFVTRCALHRDRRPSLQLSRGHDDRTALVYCHSCGRTKTKQILAAVGLTLADCFPDDLTAQRSRRREIVAEYPYVTLAGELIAVKVRYRDTFSAKRFGWRVGDRWKLTDDEKAALPLYREQDAIDSPLLFIVEGEKAADRLWTAGVPAVCAPHGAGTWEPRWTDSVRLVGAEQAIILIDADAAGRQHGEVVATALHAGGIAVKVVALPALASGQDVYDWLAAGHTMEDLDMIVGAMPAWTPDLAEQLRRQKLRAKWASDKRNQRLAKRQQGSECPPAYVRGPMSTDVCQEPSEHLRPVGSMSTLSTCPPRERTSDQPSKLLTEYPDFSVHSVHQSSTQGIPADVSYNPDLSGERSPAGRR